MKKMAKILGGLFMFVFVLILTNSVYAMTLIKPDQTNQSNIKVESNELIDDNLVTAGNEVIIRGEINDSVYVAAQKVKIEGKIHGSLFVGANDVEINGEIDEDVFAGASFVTLSDTGKIGRDLVVGASSVNINGEIGRNVWVGSSTLNVNNKIGGYINASVANINLSEKTEVIGKLTYYSSERSEIINEDKVNGGVEFKEVKQSSDSFGNQLNMWLLTLIMSLIVGILLIAIFPKRTQAISKTINDNWLKSLGIGILIFIVAPITAMICLGLIVGIPAGLVVLGFFFLFIYLAKLWVGLCLGNKLSKGNWNPYWSMILGVVILYLIYLIPYVGPIIAFLIMVVGLGGLYLSKPLEGEK